MPDLATLLRSGDRVMWSQGAAEPQALIATLMAASARIGGLGVFLGGSYSNALTPENAGGIEIHGMGAVGSNRSLCREGLQSVHPFPLSLLPRLLADGTLPIDVVLMQLGPGTRPGGHGEGAVNAYVRYALSRARIALAEINHAAPRTRSRASIDLSRFDGVIETDQPLVEVPTRSPNAVELGVARNVAELIRDGDCLQIGIGTLPAAVLECLKSHRRLGYHAGVLGDSAAALIREGVIDNSAKALDRGLSVTGALAGSADLYRFADGNNDLLLEPVDYTHSASTIARIDNFVAVNSAIEIDLTGQAGAEVAGNRYIGTIGGLPDFVRGAQLSLRGRSIICLTSRTARGEPRIVDKIESGIVTVPRYDADIVVTEYGVAELRGRSIHNRARALIKIAHPEDRDSLSKTLRHLAG